MITENSLDLLEFHKLLRIISNFAHSDASKKSVADIRPLYNRENIERRLSLIHEIRKIAHEGTPLKLSPFSDISDLIVRVKPEGAFLEASELSGFVPVLHIASTISLQIKERFDLPFLRELTNHLTGYPDILSMLNKSIDSEGNILDTASPMLSKLRSQIKRLEVRIMKKLEEIVRDNRLSIFLQDDFVTKRSGRWVIPVRMDSKGQVQGVVHDVSRSGETAFIEPLSIINLANEMENLFAEQKAEEIRILKNISSKIRSVIDEIDAEFQTIVYLDLLNCIAQFADMLKMETPQINDSNDIFLVRALHPLLFLSFRKMGNTQQVVPLDIKLGGDTTVMVITGANAGGKTIAIKTIGLLLIMALSGMPVPADSLSSLPLVHNLLIDIGDEQSIETNLSTFSAHVSHISEILQKADSKTLILIDELGTGTDPDEGAALACAVLKELRKSNALIFATTHLTAIKGFVHQTEGMMNASMEFDQNTLTPLYRLKVGEPGQSYALEIAKRYGLPESIITSAKGMLGSMKVEFDSLIADLNIKRKQYEHNLNELKGQRSEVESKNKLLEKMLSETENRQKETLAKAYKDASDIISDTKRQMHVLLEEARKKSKDKIRENIKQVGHIQEYIFEKLMEYDKDISAPPIDEIKEGDIVFVKSLGYDTSVIEVIRKHNRLKVLAGNREIEVPLSDISFKKGKSVEFKGTPIQFAQGDEAVSSKLNLVGLRVDEALSRLEPFLNHASLAGLIEITIIHGIGKGLLSKAVREHLQGHPLVKHFRSGTPEEGGNGVTIVILT
ncbi:MAG: endonuclease MutS2 [Nitrospirota bacterium]|nr:endonuclease MutS2 [Nitrospirota bacterium]